MDQALTNTLHHIGQLLSVPCRILLVILIVLALFEIGRVIVEYVCRRRRHYDDCIEIIDDIKGKGREEIQNAIRRCDILPRHKESLLKLVNSADCSKGTRLATAQRLLAVEEELNDRNVRISSIVAKLGPMIGLLGTLIPLGPGIVALGQGDTETLAKSMQVAFDTTIAGLASAATCFIILKIKNRWNEDSMSTLEALMECVLGEVDDDKE